VQTAEGVLARPEGSEACKRQCLLVATRAAGYCCRAPLDVVCATYLSPASGMVRYPTIS
jgi:hypothetical protein